MSNITLAIDDELLAASRKIAAENGMSLNAYIRDFLQQKSLKKTGKDRFRHLMAVSKQTRGASGGWKFNRAKANER
jgi:hypothetical protein